MRAKDTGGGVKSCLSHPLLKDDSANPERAMLGKALCTCM